MFRKRSVPHSVLGPLLGANFALLWMGLAHATLPVANGNPTGAPVEIPAPPIKTTDADNHTITLNKPGMISVVIGTSEDSQDAARLACRAMYPFQGKRDFQFVIVADLRDSIAAWVPSLVIRHMRKSLDNESVELRPYYLKNGNHKNPRHFCYLVPDFKGTLISELNWKSGPDQLHVTVFDADGRVMQRWENVDNMEKLQHAVQSALETLESSRSKAEAAR